MKRLLILTMLTATTISSVGCCGMGGCFRRRSECPEYEAAPCDSCQQQPCDGCANGAGPAMMQGPAVMTTPGTMVVPGPATYSSSYLPR